MNIQNPNGFTADDTPAFPVGRLDDLMADDLNDGDIVLIDDVAHKFLVKVPHGPHVFWNGSEQKEVRLSTAEMFKLQSEKRYYRPGRDTPSFSSDLHQAAHRERLEVAFNLFRREPRRKARAKWFYVAEFMRRIRDAERDGKKYSRNVANAGAVKIRAEENIELHNASCAPDEKLDIPDDPHPRSILRWVAREFDLQIQEAGLLHGNSVTPRARTIPPMVFQIIEEQIRTMVEFSHKLGPTKIQIRVNKKIDEHNAAFGTSLPKPSYSTINNEYRRFNAWIRMAKKEGVQKADIEYGAVGKLERTKRILDLVELDHHLFDLHPIVGSLGETHLGIALAQGGLDRFWVCLALDVHSGYPLGFALTFEPGGLIPALMCIDHSIRPKPYVNERWPEIDGELLGFGKPVKFRYDNAKEFVSLQLQQNLQRIGVGFELAVPKKPNSKPYVERNFGTIEQDFVHWLKGSMGSNPSEKGDRKPQKEARLGLDDFNMLFHQYLIEVYARRPQEGLDWETPEQRWIRGATNPSHRPRPLTSFEQARWDLVTTIEVDADATNEGVRWRHLFYQSDALQSLRETAGVHGHRRVGPTPVRLRIPLLDVGKAYVSLRLDDVPGGRRNDDAEIEVPASNPHAYGRTLWQHEAVCDALRRKKLEATNEANYREGFLHLFENALRAMGAPIDGKPGRVRLTGGQAPRFAGLLLDGPAAVSTSRTRAVVEKYDLLRDYAEGAAPSVEERDPLNIADDPDVGEGDLEGFANEPIEDDE